MDIFFIGIGIMCALGAIYGIYSSYSVFIGPLLGKWPEFKDFYVTRGIVVNSKTLKEQGAHGTLSKGTFGGVDLNVTNYSINHDLLQLKKADGSIENVRGEFISHRVELGDDVVVAGTTGCRETIFANLTKNTKYTNKVIGGLQLLGTIFFWSIPFIGEIMLAIYLIGIFTKNLSGVVSQSPVPNESKNIGFACLYHIIAIALGLQVYFNDHNAIAGAFQTFWFVNLAFTAIHMTLWRKDSIRFQVFLQGRIAQAAHA
jgi:hypothetical protein